MDFIHDVVFEDYFREVLAAVESRTLNYLARGRDYYFSYRSLAECRIGNLRQRGRKFHGLDGGAGENIATHFRHRIFFTVVCDIVRDHDVLAGNGRLRHFRDECVGCAAVVGVVQDIQDSLDVNRSTCPDLLNHFPGLAGR